MGTRHREGQIAYRVYCIGLVMDAQQVSWATWGPMDCFNRLENHPGIDPKSAQRTPNERSWQGVTEAQDYQLHSVSCVIMPRENAL
jgi:hypothetical protein